jgi:hypothetical protein
MKTVYNLMADYDRKAIMATVENAIKECSVVRFERIPKPRTGNQNRYYRALVTILSDYTGFLADEVHDLCLRYFAPKYKREINQKEHELTKKTRDMDTAEMAEYITKVRQMGDRIGCYLPTAEEYLINWQELEK